MVARAIMLQGTGSSVGKSLLVTGLARVLHRRGLRVMPFKPQNMSNNAAVTVDGGEIGRAQALQARAAYVAPTVHMNPVLLKPQSEVGAQIVVQGKMAGTARAREYQQIKATLMPQVLDSFSRLKRDADVVLVEGAGSASEINLRANDIANMGFARAADVPVVVVGSIDSGGVIASLVGTKTVIDPADAAMVVGFIVNRMRGDPTLFADGMAAIARMTGWAPLGLVPYLDAANRLPAEDVHEVAWSRGHGQGRVRIAVPRLPHIANFDDLDPLRTEPDVELTFVAPGQPLPAPAELVILAGSKATIADMRALRAEGWDLDIASHVRHGGRVLGLCGGYQLLGKTIADPSGIEGPAETVTGLGLLNVDTVLGTAKALREVRGVTITDDVSVRGYEMHVGVTDGPDAMRPVVRLVDGRCDGAHSADGTIAGTYLHGFFADDRQRAAWIERLGGTAGRRSYDAEIEAALDALADHVTHHIDVERLISLMR